MGPWRPDQKKEKKDYIDRQGHGDWYISLRSWKSCKNVIIDLGWNTYDGIRVNPSRTIGSIIPQITSLNSGIGIEFFHNYGDGIPPRNIGRFGLFDRGTGDISNRRASWHVAAKIESENPGDNSIFENYERENNFQVEKFGRENSVILNNVNLNHIDTDLDQSNHIYSNHADSNNDSSEVCALNQLLFWDGDSTDAAAKTVYTITPLAYVPSIHTAHTPSPVHPLYFYPPLPSPQTFTYGTR